jgi:hypothetical protein
MKKQLKTLTIGSRASLIACAFALATMPMYSNADEVDDDVAKQENALNQQGEKPGFEAALKEKYSLTDEQIKALRDQGMNSSQMTVTAAFAKASGKTTDEIAKMRLEQKMGWGKIAKELGIAPKEIGQSIASMHNHKEEKIERKEDRRKEREERKAEKKENRDLKKAERAERKHGKK